MPKVYVNLSEVRRINGTLPSLSFEMDRLRRAVGLLRDGIGEETAEKYKIGKRLKEVEQQMCSVEKQMEEIYAVVNSCVEQYSEAERDNSSNIEEFN